MVAKSMDLTWITVSDLKKAVDYYTNTLGLKLNELNEEFGWAELIGSDGGAILGIAQQNDMDNMPAGTNGIVTITVENIEEAKKELEGKNVQFVGDILHIPNIVKMQMFQDADGNKMQLVQSFEGNK